MLGESHAQMFRECFLDGLPVDLALLLKLILVYWTCYHKLRTFSFRKHLGYNWEVSAENLNATMQSFDVLGSPLPVFTLGGPILYAVVVDICGCSSSGLGCWLSGSFAPVGSTVGTFRAVVYQIVKDDALDISKCGCRRKRFRLYIVVLPWASLPRQHFGSVAVTLPHSWLWYVAGVSHIIYY